MRRSVAPVSLRPRVGEPAVTTVVSFVEASLCPLLERRRRRSDHA
ncbi:MAG TPA: hypothetical protein VN668_01425 [Stellaceae bacterium]|nr:hypothetical protein [Stellaceae bacterium]